MRFDVMIDLIAVLAIAIWFYLLVGRGAFWRCLERDGSEVAGIRRWPRVTAVIPARNEADAIAASIGSLLRQDYPGQLMVVLVDDDSDDETAETARRAATDLEARHRFTLVEGRGVAPGWTGKLWAMRQGIEAATAEAPDYLLLTDADIVHAPDSVRALVDRAARGRLVLTSLMARLRCETWAERVHVPAFVYFFQMLFPFSWVNDHRRSTAAAAGGCMLVKTDALQTAGGIESIRGALIDDCALAKRMKAVGPIWLGLTDRVVSIRPYDWAEAERMVARSAYAQLDHSPLLLAGCTVGMALTFLAGPLLALFGGGVAQILGLLVWLLIALSFQPMLRFYRLSPLWGLALPAIALAYMLYTLDSAWRSIRGRGGEWKGRMQASAWRS